MGTSKTTSKVLCLTYVRARIIKDRAREIFCGRGVSLGYIGFYKVSIILLKILFDFMRLLGYTVISGESHH